MNAYTHIKAHNLRLSARPVDGGYELLYEYKRSKSIRKRIKLPEITLPSGSTVDYIEYSVRDSEKGGVNATLRRILQFNDVSFEIEQYARYEGILDGEVLYLPRLKITQGSGDNIINKGDVFKIEFDSPLPLSWIKSFEDDNQFDIDIKGKSAIELTYKGLGFITNVNIRKPYYLPKLSFKFKKPGLFKKIDDMDLSGGIGFKIHQKPKDGDWEFDYEVSVHEDGIDVGRMNLISVTNMPIYEDIPDYIEVESLVLRERGEIITASDTIRITPSEGAKYDARKRPQVTNAKLSKITSDEIILTGYTESDIIVNSIPVVISDREKMDIHLIVDISGSGYKQKSLSSEPIFHDGLTDTLYYARSLTNYVIPTYKLGLPGKLSSGDTLGVLLSGDIDLKLQRPVKHQLESMGAFKYLSAKPVKGGYELLYEYKRSKSIRKRIKLPEIILPNGSKVDYVEYSVRDSEKGGVNATLRRILQFNDISFEIEEYARYEGILDGEVLYLPRLKITQGSGDNIINKGDVFKIEFDSPLPLSWIKSFEDDNQFDIDIKGKSAIELTYKGLGFITNVNIRKPYYLPKLSFKFKKPGLFKKIDDMDLSGGIGFKIHQKPKDGDWEFDYEVSVHEDGIDVGRMNLISVTNMPIYEDIPDYIEVESLVLRERGEIITASDTIRITPSEGAKYDARKRPQVTNAKLSKITSDEIILTGYTESDIIVNSIPVVISDREKMDIHLIVDISGSGYKQKSLSSEPIFHDGLTDTLYYARSLTNYVIPTYKLGLPGKLSSGDTLGVLLSGDIDLKLQRPVKHQLESMGAFKYLSAKPVKGGYELLYEYKRSKSIRKRIKLPEIILPNGSKVDYVEYSVRDSEKGGVNATLRRILQFNDISFEIEEYARYEGMLDGDILSLPPIKLTQGSGDNIINKGDVFKLEFDSPLPLTWMGKYTDSYFDIDRKGKSTLELTYLRDTVLTEHTLPQFNFKFKKPGLFKKIDDMDN